jgi:hypothetical protein
MANVVNGSFEDPAIGLPGYADGWTSGVLTTAERLAAFGTSNPRDDFDSFEAEWSSNESYLFAFDPLVDIVAPLFDTSVSPGETFEDYEEGWSTNEGYSFTMGSSTNAEFDSTLDDVEDFEEEWSSNEGYSFAMGSATAASFDVGGTPEDVEDFEERWSSNQSYAFTMGSTTAASFDTGGTPEAVEDFEETAASIIVVANPGTVDFTATAHGMANGERVTFESDGEMPLGLSGGVAYYVITAAANTFQVSLTLAGPAHAFYTGANGELRVLRDPSRFWLSFLS